MSPLVEHSELPKTPAITAALERAYSQCPAASNAQLIEAAQRELGSGFTSDGNVERVIWILRMSGELPAPGSHSSHAAG
ncbi:MAG: hypothetical protein ABSE73_00895 [Planctomycetota bacterium]